MNTVSLSFENGSYGAKLISATSDGITEKIINLASSVIDSIISSLNEENDKSCSFSFHGAYNSYGHKSLVLHSPNITGEWEDSLSPLPEDFNFDSFSFLSNYIDIGGEIFGLQKIGTDFLIENTGSFPSMTYCYNDDMKTKHTAVIQGSDFVIPIEEGKIICVETETGKQYLK